MRWYLFAVLSLLTAAVHGQSIYKCKQHDGTTAYQDSPCPGTPNAPPMTVAGPDSAMPTAHPYGGGPTGGAGLNPQQARALIDQLMRAHQFNAAMAVAKQNGQMAYLSQRDIQGPSAPLGPTQSPGAPQPQGDDLSPEQRQQLKQKLEALQTVMQGLAAKNAVPAPPGVSPDAHQLPWTVVFVTNADGSFSPRGPIRYNGASYSGPDAKFTHQALFAGVDLTSMQGHNVWAHFDGRILVIDKFQ